MWRVCSENVCLICFKLFFVLDGSRFLGPAAAQGKYHEAETLFKRSLVIRENELGTEHPDVATVLDNLGDLSISQVGNDVPSPRNVLAL